MHLSPGHNHTHTHTLHYLMQLSEIHGVLLIIAKFCQYSFSTSTFQNTAIDTKSVSIPDIHKFMITCHNEHIPHFSPYQWFRAACISWPHVGQLHSPLQSIQLISPPSHFLKIHFNIILQSMPGRSM